AFLTLDHVELDLLAFAQRLEARGVDPRMVDEDILLSIITRDEAEALLVVEPLHGSLGTHVLLLNGVVTMSSESITRTDGTCPLSRKSPRVGLPAKMPARCNKKRTLRSSSGPVGICPDPMRASAGRALTPHNSNPETPGSPVVHEKRSRRTA